MTVPLQSGEAVTRPTFWQISPVGEVLFYYFAAVALAVFGYGVYERITRYTRGNADPFDRLEALPSRVVAAAASVGSTPTSTARSNSAMRSL